MNFATRPIPTLDTSRLTLRPFELSDAKQVQELAGDYELAKTTANIPHPYEGGMAEDWISRHAEKWRAGDMGTWAITNKTDGNLVGCIGLDIALQHKSGELGYWVGRPYWGNGYGTEAAQAVVDYAFMTLKLHRIMGRHMSENPASSRIMQKVGMTYEGMMREAEIRWGNRVDICFYGILQHEWAASRKG
ncbi:MAG: GNAT family protein [Chloroflexota bacterium]